MTAEQRQQNINDAREMLDHLDRNPEIPFAGVTTFNWFYGESDKATFLGIARSLGAYDKSVAGDKLRIVREFGRSKITAEIPQSLVCRKVVVTKEVEEYECDPLLSIDEMADLDEGVAGTAEADFNEIFSPSNIG